MNRPLPNPDTALERFLQGLPEDSWDRAIEFKAFSRSRTIKTPAQWLQVVRCDCGLDQVLRETAGTVTLLEERLSDTAIHKRLRACWPWVNALLERMLGADAAPLLEGGYVLWWWTARGRRGRERTGPGIDGTSRWTW